MFTTTSADSGRGLSHRNASTARRWLDTLLLFAIPGYLFLNLFTLRGVPHFLVSDALDPITKYQ